jgi:26S proteasome regulatory subunit N7
MPVENLEEEGLDKNPNLQLAQWRFLLGTEKHINNKKTKNDLIEALKADST